MQISQSRRRTVDPVRRALITGVTGQDGTYLSRLLFEREYEVHGVVRPGDVLTVPENVMVHVADLRDVGALSANRLVG